MLGIGIRGTAACAGVLVLLASIATVAGQDASDSGKPNPAVFVKAGQVFEPFTFWQQVQLGATGLMKPQVARNASFVYAYQPDVLAKWESPDLILGIKSVGGYKALDPAESAKLTAAIKAGIIESARKADIKVLVMEPLPEKVTAGASAAEVMIGWPN